uniref:Uncharacterized protein n=1 Tax=Alexandrium monilatum TaxID=311494 RepID=A0A7S4V3U4_9DINO
MATSRHLWHAHAERVARARWRRCRRAARRPRPLYQDSSEDALYHRFTRGPVLGPSPAEVGGAEAKAWRALVVAALQGAGGALPWQELRDEVVQRRRQKARESGSIEDESLWAYMALAHIPDAFLSHSDEMVRLVPN